MRHLKAQVIVLDPSSHERAAIKPKGFACLPSTVEYGHIDMGVVDVFTGFPVYQGSTSPAARIGCSVSKMGRSAAVFSK
jgi:hypothetical protein